MSNYIPLNIQLFATGITEESGFEVDVYEHDNEDGSVEVTLNASTTLYGLYSQKYDKDVTLEWSEYFPTNIVSRIFTEPFSDIIACRNKWGEEYIIYIDVTPGSPVDPEPDPTPSTSASGIISLNGINFSDIKFNNYQISAVYYNGICVWTLEDEDGIPDNAITYDWKYVTYNDQYIVYEEGK